MNNDEKIKEYEAHKTPVPSYDELQNINKSVNDLMASNIKIVEKNTKLKELLKECKYELRGCYTDIGWEDQSLINKIDQVLGEDK